ncbi:MAG: synthase subunit [Pseudomonadota bacterium]|jgi:F-type H+-transporting ATPase subunit a
MASGYNYLSHLTADPNLQKFSLALMLGGGLVLAGKALAGRLSTPHGVESAIVPDKKLTLFGAVDFVIEAFLNYHDSVLGKDNRHHFPFTASVFFFLLLSNFLGLVPGMPAITTTVWINVGMAFVVFFYFNGWGIKANGLWGYIKHFFGPMAALAWFFFPLEIFSTCLRVLTLNLRLYWNITADHMVLEIFTNMLGPISPLVFLALGTFVCFMQAFIFTTLTMVYILLATQHEEDGHH